MTKIRVAINGFGRIGRVVARLIAERNDMMLVAVNDLTDNKTLAHLLKYDSIHRMFNGEINYNEEGLLVNGQLVKTFSEKDPTILPWGELQVDVVIESTGVFRTKEAASKHITAGAKKVIVSAPAKGGGVPGFVIGINDNLITGKETVISNASCTTNCAAPMVKIIDELCGIEHGLIGTVHSYTGDQRLHDAPHTDLRRARAAAVSIIPTSTGAAEAIAEIFPHLNGRIDGSGIRVPVPDGSITELTCLVKRTMTPDTINNAFLAASEGELKGILGYTHDPIVSVDTIGSAFSCLFDPELTVVQGSLVKISGWYDNEFGYSNRLVELVQIISR
jgi:glyceraldehyde 3-phosphate dehydrogenase